ncbi:MAG: GntR family transcriptional regulator [Spirochaetota bacterium]
MKDSIMVLNNLNSVKHLTLEKRVYREILRGIISGKLTPGTSVTITELAEQLGVSLMPVRQALKTLEAKNLIHIQKNRRLIIRKLSIDDLNELFEIRMKLEHDAALNAARNCTEQTVERLKTLLAEMKDCNDTELYLEKNREFHHTIYQSAGKPILFEIIEDLWHRVSPYMYLYLKRDVNNHDLYHEGILKGMRNRNPQEVCKWLKIDLKKAAQELADQLTAQPEK